MLKVKAFTLNAGGSVQGIGERLEKEANELLSKHPDLEIESVVVIPTSSGLQTVLVFYKEDEKE